jgi:hypothetical protein
LAWFAVEKVWAEIAQPHSGDCLGTSFLSRPRQARLVQRPDMNRLLFGDNLKWLRDTRIFPDASVDLVYLDAPQLNPFAKAQREAKPEKQQEML